MILFEDDAIQVIGLPGRTDYVVITFGDMLDQADGMSFKARSLLEKNFINAVGIMPKRRHWYPPTSMSACKDAVRSITERFGHAVFYGGSMGAYAAVKFSALLGATTTIAMCPQWSIAPHEVGNHDRRYQEFFTGDGGSAVTPADVRGAVYLFYDPSFRVDAFNATRIAGLGDVVLLPVHNVGHNVMPVLAGGAVMLSLLDAAMSRDHKRLQAIISKTRRSHRLHTMEVLGRSFRRFPCQSASILESGLERVTAAGGAEFLGLLAQRLIAGGSHQEAREQLERGQRLNPKEPLVLFGLGELAIRADRFEEGLSLMEAATAGPGLPALKLRYASHRTWFEKIGRHSSKNVVSVSCLPIAVDAVPRPIDV